MTVPRHAVLSVLLGCSLLATGTRAQEDQVGAAVYRRLTTRAASERAVLDQLAPEAGVWGQFFLASPFPYAGHGSDDLLTAHGPQDELDAMVPGGPGPDLARTFTGKAGTAVAWEPLGDVANRMVELNVHDDEALNDEASCYLYGTIETGAASTVTVAMGSDDGLAVWLNGALVHAVDEPRGLDPQADQVALPLVAGTNHLLVKVTEGAGGWAWQVTTRPPLPTAQLDQLHGLLDRDFPPSPERAHWAVTTVATGDEPVLEVGGLAVRADGRPVVATRRGEVWLVDGAEGPTGSARFTRLASGLHEPLGLAVREEQGREVYYTVQRGELTRLVDEDGDLDIDLFETVNAGWGVSGNYHEFAFGPVFDGDGNAWLTLNVGFCGSLGKSTVPYRGWACYVTPSGELVPVCDGLRSPNGIGRLADGTMVYVDNQGDYVATNRLSELTAGSWHGHPASLRWRDDLEEGRTPPRQPASVWFPYRRMGQSAADVVLIDEDGRFGPFDGQLLVGDQTLASVMRVSLERVEGQLQGACYPFLESLDCGVNRLAFAPDGALFVGQTDRGWASVGRRRHGLQRVAWKGTTPFAIQAMEATPDGFRLRFTGAVERASAADPASYRLSSHTYAYHADYGAPEDDQASLDVTAVRLLDDTTVELTVSPLREGYVHCLDADGVRSAADPDQGLLHGEAYYTLQRRPSEATAGDDLGAAPRPAPAAGREPVPAADPSLSTGALAAGLGVLGGVTAVQETPADEPDQALPRLLFLTHSAGFRHPVVTRPEPHVLSHAEQQLLRLTRGRYDVLATQDCGQLTPEALDDLDVLAFYTTGELPIPPETVTALLDWVEDGGAFVGIHCATDTWYQVPRYMDMIGGAFDGHPWHQAVTLAVEDGDHPSTRHLGDAWELTDEIYQHRDWQRFPLAVLLRLDGDEALLARGKRADRDVANAWWKPYGRGRVFYTALGHREEVWTSEAFQRHLLGGIEWARRGPDTAVPAPAGAELLIGGDDLGAWRHRQQEDPAWSYADGVATVGGGAGDLLTREDHGDGLLHVEFAMTEGGNSGVYLQGRYEIQVYDTAGQEQVLNSCGALYNQAVPARDGARPPGPWQYLDIRFRAPRFGPDGVRSEPARVSVWLNGLLILEDVAASGPTPGGLAGDEVPRGPLLLQDHGHPIRYRNVWWLPDEA